MINRDVSDEKKKKKNPYYTYLPTDVYYCDSSAVSPKLNDAVIDNMYIYAQRIRIIMHTI